MVHGILPILPVSDGSRAESSFVNLLGRMADLAGNLAAQLSGTSVFPTPALSARVQRRVHLHGIALSGY